MQTRREFLHTVGALGTAGFLSSLSFEAFGVTPKTDFKPLKIGMIADIHRDLTPDADGRLETFMKKVEEEKPDFLISLGDFAHAIPDNEAFVRRFASSVSPVYHVLGNHEMDRVDKQTAVAFLGMPSAYYSFDFGGYHCVVLDPNHIYDDGKYMDYEKGNYFRFGEKVSYMDDEQCDWLKDDLRKTNLPTFLFSHQGLDGSIPNREMVRMILEHENERCGFRKILGCFNGHYHLDYHRAKNDIHFFGINSVSYYWHNEKVPGRYAEDLKKKYPNLDNMAMYKDPLFCFVTIDSSGKLSLRGVKSEWVDVPPASAGTDVSPVISDYHISLI